MAENSWPFENADTTEAQFAKWASALVGSGVISGLETTVSSGMGLSLAVGSAIVRGVFYENVTAPKALTVGAAAGTTRKDAVVLRLDLAANTIIAAVKAGSTAGGGTLPALTQNSTTWEHLIAEITVPGGATNLVSGNISTKLAGVGQRILDYFAADRPTPTDPVVIGLDKTNKKLELWIGASWYVLNPDLSWANVTGKPATFAPSAHNHDDRYYTESEVDTKIADAITAALANYYTKTEADAKLGGRKYTPSASAPVAPANGDFWDELT